MGEVLTLTTPIPGLTLTTYVVDDLHLSWSGERIIGIVLGTNGEVVRFSYHGAVATTLMRAFNKANFSVKSMHKILLERLVTDGKLPAGAVSGTPD